MAGPSTALESRPRRPRSRVAQLATRILAITGAVFLFVTCTPVNSWWAAWLAGPVWNSTGDVLIVLGGDYIAGGMLGESSYWRSVYAVRAWREGHFRQLILTGESRITVPMRRYIVSEGVPQSAIRIEPNSTSTRENAINTARMIGPSVSRPVLLTSDFHVFRAYRAFRKAGLAVAPSPAPDAAKRAQFWRNRWTVFCVLVIETAKIAYYAARGWI